LSFVRNRAIVFAYIGLAVLVALTATISPGLLRPSHVGTLLILASFIGIVAVGQTFVILSGGIDLSIPWVLTSAAILLTKFCGGSDAALAWAAPTVLLGGCAVGAINGVGIAIFDVPPIIMTLAVNVVIQGLILVDTSGAPTASAPSLVQFSAVGYVGPLPVALLVWAVLALAASVILSKTALGRYLYALGSNKIVARFSGVPVIFMTIIPYVLSGFTAAMAGILLTGYSGQAYLGMGDPYLFTSIAAVAIGGASVLGGSGHYVGTLAGASVLTLLTSLLSTLNLSNGALLLVYGLVILLTISLSSEEWGNVIRRLPKNQSERDADSVVHSEDRTL